MEQQYIQEDKSIFKSGTTTDVGWKIFYADNSNIYLIADNYVERNNLPNSTTESGVVTANKSNDGGSIGQGQHILQYIRRLFRFIKNNR